MALPPFSPILLTEELFALELAALENTYPNFRIRRREEPQPYHYAVGYLQPLHPKIPVGVVAATMLERQPFDGDEWGYLYPKDTSLEPVRIRECPELYEPQLVEVVYTTDGPEPYLVAPRVDPRTQPLLSHLYRRPHPCHQREPDKYPSHSSCILAAEDQTFQFGRDRVAMFLHYITRHIGALRLWRYGDVGRWPLPEASHFPLDALLQISVTAPCHCQRDLAYGNCCRPQDLKNLRADMRVGKPLAKRWNHGPVGLVAQVRRAKLLS